jgi:hypothetical protein
MSTQNKSDSLRWAIDELSKQKEELGSKLNIAQKRDDTSSLIEEVNAQKKALDKRISSLEDGLRTSSELVEESVESLEEELNSVGDKLEIAKDRLNALEQEEYLEELGRKLNGDFSENSDTNNMKIDDTLSSHDEIAGSIESVQNLQSAEISSKDSLSSSSPTISPTLVKSPTNRIQSKESEESQSRIQSSNISESIVSLNDCPEATLQDLNQCAKDLGVEPEFLLNKGIQAVLRMIERNGNKLSFPLEVQQLD